MGKYGDFTVILDETNYVIFIKSFNKWLNNESSKCDGYCKYNNDIIYTFHDNSDQNYSDREIYSVIDDYEDLNIYFDKKKLNVIHPLKIYSSSFCIELKVPIYDTNTSMYNLRLAPLYANMSINSYELDASQFNCIYMNSNKEAFSIAKCNSSNKFPKFIFYYDDELLTKKEVIYLIKKIICMDFD